MLGSNVKVIVRVCAQSVAAHVTEFVEAVRPRANTLEKSRVTSHGLVAHTIGLSSTKLTATDWPGARLDELGVASILGTDAEAEIGTKVSTAIKNAVNANRDFVNIKSD